MQKSLRIGVHHANAVVWEPVYRTRLIRAVEQLPLHLRRVRRHRRGERRERLHVASIRIHPATFRVLSVADDPDGDQQARLSAARKRQERPIPRRRVARLKRVVPRVAVSDPPAEVRKRQLENVLVHARGDLDGPRVSVSVFVLLLPPDARGDLDDVIDVLSAARVEVESLRVGFVFRLARRREKPPSRAHHLERMRHLHDVRLRVLYLAQPSPALVRARDGVAGREAATRRAMVAARVAAVVVVAAVVAVRVVLYKRTSGWS